MSIFANKVKSVIIKLIAPGDKVLVAVSGGADSLALLYLLDQFSKELGYELSVAHLNHLARGDESDGDASFVVKVAEKLSLPVFVEKIDVRKSFLKTSFQESARILRYQFLEKTLTSIKGNKIALGHTADDQVETVLMNLLRGAGLRGIAGINEVRGHVIRPLLRFNRYKLEQFLDERNLTYCMDSSNNETKYLRNKIRHEIIPFLSNFSNNISENLFTLAEIARGEEQWMSEKTCELYAKLVTTQNDDLCFKVFEFEKQPLALKRRLIRETFYRLSGSLRQISAVHVRQVLSLFEHSRVGSLIKLPLGVSVVCDYGMMRFSITKNLGLPESEIRLKKLEIPGVTNLVHLRIQFHAHLVEPYLPERVNQMQAYLDFEKTGKNIQVRFFKNGDSFVPLGMRGHKKLKSYFIDKKIPRKKRPFIPIFINDEDDIVWIYGERISDLFRVTENTKKMLFIEGKGL
jgi:tRNA(Ile)-lysidine synthase